MTRFILFLALVASCQLQAQVWPGSSAAATFFDPEREPIAVRADSSLQLIVSEYLLAKAVTTRLGVSCRVNEISKQRRPDGAFSLDIIGLFDAKGTLFALEIPLVPDVEGRFYHAAAEAAICSTPGCSNCGVQNGKCVGCCQPSNEAAGKIILPMIKVPVALDR
jgi:hypothetical protein